MARASETRAKIEAAALELFVTQGVQQTSLRQIADRLGITKPALYYHFASREELVRSLVQPFLDDVEKLIVDHERAGDRTPRQMLEAYFDVTYRHRAISQLIVRDLSALSFLDLGRRVVEWRRRIVALLVGPDADLAAQARAVVAIGGLADCTVMFADRPVEQLRAAAVNAACAALAGTGQTTRPGGGVTVTA